MCLFRKKNQKLASSLTKTGYSLLNNIDILWKKFDLKFSKLCG